MCTNMEMKPLQAVKCWVSRTEKCENAARKDRMGRQSEEIGEDVSGEWEVGDFLGHEEEDRILAIWSYNPKSYFQTDIDVA